MLWVEVSFFFSLGAFGLSLLDAHGTTGSPPHHGKLQWRQIRVLANALHHWADGSFGLCICKERLRAKTVGSSWCGLLVKLSYEALRRKNGRLFNGLTCRLDYGCPTRVTFITQVRLKVCATVAFTGCGVGTHPSLNSTSRFQ